MYLPTLSASYTHAHMHTHTHTHTQVYEETGFDIRDLIRDDQYLEAQVGDNNARMYIIPGVPEETSFAPKTRKEIRVRNDTHTQPMHVPGHLEIRTLCFQDAFLIPKVLFILVYMASLPFSYL